MVEVSKARPDLTGEKAETAESQNSVVISEASASRHTIESEEEVLPAIIPKAEQPPLGVAPESSNNSTIQRIWNDRASPEKALAEMSSHRFWSTQPVPMYDENKVEIKEGPIKTIDKAQVATEPSSLLAGFEWVTMDLTNNEELKEVFELLYAHYVEDDESEFRLNYSPSFLRW
jgi:glycylpeptide N-tetradecanoyltransferase